MIAALLGRLVGCGPAYVPEDVRPVDLDDVPAYLAALGAVEMVPPVPLPQPDGGTVEVWLAVPDGAPLALVAGPDRRPALSYPAGTVADRVERRRDRVVDVRGTRIDAHGRRWHHVYRAASGSPGALVGVEWPADDPALHAAAVELLVARLRDAGARGDLEGVRSKLDCEGCHRRLRPEASVHGEHGVVARGTDDAGWFTPTTVLRLDGVVERYGTLAPDPWLEVRCPDGASPQGTRCPGGALPRARYALTDALAAADLRAASVCRSWQALADHLPDPGEHPCRG